MALREDSTGTLPSALDAQRPSSRVLDTNEPRVGYEPWTVMVSFDYQ